MKIKNKHNIHILIVLVLVILMCVVINTYASNPNKPIKEASQHVANTVSESNQLVFDMPSESSTRPAECEETFIIVDSDKKTLNYRVEFFEVTAYTAGFESCGKLPSDPLYGHTALSGRKENNFEYDLVEEWLTVAAPWSLPFGTKIFIPYFEDMPNHGLFEVRDRGGAITEGHLDIYMVELSDALKFGRRTLEVWIIED